MGVGFAFFQTFENKIQITAFQIKTSVGFFSIKK